MNLSLMTGEVLVVASEGAEPRICILSAICFDICGVTLRSPATGLYPTVSPEAVRAQLGPDADLSFLTEAIRDGVLSFLGIPLLIGERLIGVITLVHHEANHFTEDDRWQLSRLAAQASIAIDNAIRVRQRESTLKQQICELQIEIDEAKKARQVAEITETDYFRELSQKAQRLREKR